MDEEEEEVEEEKEEEKSKAKQPLDHEVGDIKIPLYCHYLESELKDSAGRH